MKIIIDTQEMNDANEFGEALRNYAFLPKDQRGCYSTFALKQEFRKIKKECKLGQLLLKHLGMNPDGSVGEGDWKEQFNPSLYSNGNIHLGWYWDGDGILVVIEGSKIAVNSDCKKDYTWEWV